MLAFLVLLLEKRWALRIVFWLNANGQRIAPQRDNSLAEFTRRLAGALWRPERHHLHDPFPRSQWGRRAVTANGSDHFVFRDIPIRRGKQAVGEAGPWAGGYGLNEVGAEDKVGRVGCCC